jgi:diadenosine tetraphosphate (Ap4A) HIT family hydrolase
MTQLPPCLGCQIAAGYLAPPGGDIWRDDTWHLAHDAHNVVPGFLVLGTIPHITHLYDIPDSHYVFGWRLLRVVRQIMAEQLGFKDCITFQNDHTSGHFHVWVLPLYPEMRSFGLPPEGVIPFLQWTKTQWKTPEKYAEINHIAETLRQQVSLWAEKSGSFLREECQALGEALTDKS